MKIPKVIHQIWIGDKPFPYKKERETWRKNHKDWELKLWTDENLPEIFNRKLYDAIPYYAGKADILRLELLANYGGLYVDADSVSLKPIDPLIENYESFAMTGNAGMVSVALMGCTENNKTFQKLKLGLTNYFRQRIEKAERTGEVPTIHILGTWYVTPRLREDPKFCQIEKGRRMGTRKFLVTTPGEVCEDTFVQQLDDNTWKEELRGGKTFSYIKI